MAAAQAADRRVAGHGADGRELVREQQRCAHPSGHSPRRPRIRRGRPPITMTSWCGMRRVSAAAARRRQAATARRFARVAALRAMGRWQARSWRESGWSGPGGLVFGFAGLLALIAFLPRLAARLRLPYTVLLAALGCALGSSSSLSGMLLDADAGADHARFPRPAARCSTSRPTCCSGCSCRSCCSTPRRKLDGRELLDDVGPILILAVVAVLMTTAAAGLGRLVGVRPSASASASWWPRSSPPPTPARSRPCSARSAPGDA